MTVFLDPAALILLALAGPPQSAAAQPAAQPAAQQLPPQQGASFLSAIEDVPLPDGLIERSEAIADFDGPGGRIVTVQAAGFLAPPDITAFYDAAMPALGWRREGAVWLRGRAQLSISFRRSERDVIVTYRLIERPASLGLD
jgi:hypothetical protein